MLFLPSRWLGGEKHGGAKKNLQWWFLLATLPGICRVLTWEHSDHSGRRAA
ncbi:hypothetical protein ACKUUM_31505 [Klebsiella oxytoca]